MVWYITNYDPTLITTENDFGINALVIHRPFMEDIPYGITVA